jgi:hypothetical protein
MATTPKKFVTAAQVGATGDVEPGTAVSVSPDSASLQASRRGVGQTVALTDLMQPPPEPELDLVTVTMRIPRYLANALRLQSKLTNINQQELTATGLRAGLDQGIVDQCYMRERR